METENKSPLPWKITHDDCELRIVDANGRGIIYGNVNRGIEFDDPKVPSLLSKAISLLNESPKKPWPIQDYEKSVLKSLEDPKITRITMSGCHKKNRSRLPPPAGTQDNRSRPHP